MAVVKLKKKENLDELIAKITLRLGKKPTQQDILDLCVTLGQEHFEELIIKLTNGPKLNDDKIKKIKEMQKRLSKVKFQPLVKESFSNPEDHDIYSS